MTFGEFEQVLGTVNGLISPFDNPKDEGVENFYRSKKWLRDLLPSVDMIEFIPLGMGAAQVTAVGDKFSHSLNVTLIS